MGSDFWEERIELNALYNPVNMEGVNARSAEHYSGRLTTALSKAEKARLFDKMREGAKPKAVSAPSCLEVTPAPR